MNDFAESAIRRILVALDASAQSLAALEEAATLAAAMEAELMGLFVEDINLVRIAGLPFARQISYPSGEEEHMSSARIDLELRARAELARKAIAAAAERRHMPWSFRIVRGEVTGEILGAASQADLIFIGTAGCSPARGMGSTAKALVAGARGAFLLVQQVVPEGEPILALDDGTDGARRALDMALRLANARQVSLVVFLSAATPEAAERLEQQATQVLGNRTKHLQFRRLYDPSPRSFAEALRKEGGGLLVLPGESSLAREQGVRLLLQLTRNPVLLIR
jgi:nucleotide-binding universal stress UspA family protein